MEKNQQMTQKIGFSMGLRRSLCQTGFSSCPQTRFICTASRSLQLRAVNDQGAARAASSQPGKVPQSTKVHFSKDALNSPYKTQGIYGKIMVEKGIN